MKPIECTLALLGLSGFLAVSSCSDSTSPSPSASDLNLAPATGTILVGQTLQLQPSLLDTAGQSLPTSGVVFTSRDQGVAVVNRDGLITGIGPGTARIVASYTSLRDSMSVTVLPAGAVQVLLSPDSVVVGVGARQTFQLTATVYDAFGRPMSAEPSYSSSAPSVFMVSASGTVTAVSAGTGWARATAGIGADSSFVTVLPAGPVQLLLSPETVALAVNQTFQMTATAYDAFGLPLSPQVSYTSGAPSVFTVSASGMLTAVAPGNGWVHATAGIAADSSLVLVSSFSGVLQPRLAVGGGPYGLALSSQSVLYVTQLSSGAVLPFSVPALTAGTPIPTGSIYPVDVAFSANGQTAYVAHLDGAVVVVDVAGGSVSATYNAGFTAWRVLPSADGTKLYVSSSDGRIRVLAAGTGSVLTTITAATDGINSLVLSSDGSKLYASSIAGTVTEINTASDTVGRTMTVSGFLQGLAWSPDRADLYVAVEGGALKVLHVATGLVTGSVTVPTGAFSVAVSPDGKWIVVTTWGYITVLDRPTLVTVRQFTVDGREKNLAYDAAGTLYIAAESGGLDVIK